MRLNFRYRNLIITKFIIRLNLKNKIINNFNIVRKWTYAYRILKNARAHCTASEAGLAGGSSWAGAARWRGAHLTSLLFIIMLSKKWTVKAITAGARRLRSMLAALPSVHVQRSSRDTERLQPRPSATVTYW